MESIAMRKTLLASVLVGILAAAATLQNMLANNCGCAPNLCCSQHGYCGRGKDYCGTGRALGLKLKLLRHPETVATNPVVSFKTALWYLMTAVRPVVSQGLWATIRAINGQLERGGKGPQKVQRRIGSYRHFCKKFAVDPGAKLSC